MNSITITLLASFLAASANLFFRINSSHKSTASVNGYLFIYYFISFIASLFFFSEVWSSSISWQMIFLGGIVGGFNVALMVLTANALNTGPSGLTFAFQNASSVFPGFLLFIIFGTAYGFSCSITQLAGMALVILGLYLGAVGNSSGGSVSKKWLIWALGAFSVQVIALAIIQGRCILFDSPLINITAKDDPWFMPGQFGISTLLIGLVYLKEKSSLSIEDVKYGSLAGVANCAATGCLLLATKWALPTEKAVLFPIFAVTNIVLCNAWANRFYQEKFNLLSNAICALGIFLSLSL